MTFIIYDFFSSLLNTDNIFSGGGKKYKIRARSTTPKRRNKRNRKKSRQKIKDKTTEQLEQQLLKLKQLDNNDEKIQQTKETLQSHLSLLQDKMEIQSLIKNNPEYWLRKILNNTIPEFKFNQFTNLIQINEENIERVVRKNKTDKIIWKSDNDKRPFFVIHNELTEIMKRTSEFTGVNDNKNVSLPPLFILVRTSHPNHTSLIIIANNNNGIRRAFSIGFGYMGEVSKMGTSEKITSNFSDNKVIDLLKLKNGSLYSPDYLITPFDKTSKNNFQKYSIIDIGYFTEEILKKIEFFMTKIDTTAITSGSDTFEFKRYKFKKSSNIEDFDNLELDYYKIQKIRNISAKYFSNFKIPTTVNYRGVSNTHCSTDNCTSFIETILSERICCNWKKVPGAPSTPDSCRRINGKITIKHFQILDLILNGRSKNPIEELDDLVNYKEETTMGCNIMGGMEIENIVTGKVTEYNENRKNKIGYSEYFLSVSIGLIYAQMKLNSHANSTTMIKIPFEESVKNSYELLQNLMNYCGERNDICVTLAREIKRKGYTKWFVNLMEDAEFEIENQFNQRLPEHAKIFIKRYLPTILNQVQLFIFPSNIDKINDSDIKLYRPQQLLLASPEDKTTEQLSILETINENAQDMYDDLTYYLTGENLGQTQQFHVEEMIRNSVRRVCEQTESRLIRTYEISNEESNTGYILIMTILIMYMMLKVFLKISSKITQTKKIKAHKSTEIVPY